MEQITTPKTLSEMIQLSITKMVIYNNCLMEDIFIVYDY